MMGLSFEEEFQHQINIFISDRRQNKVVGSFDIAIQTVLLLRRLVGGTKWSDEKELIESIKNVAAQIMEDTLEISAGNMVRRILKLVREEYDELAGKKSDGKILLIDFCVFFSKFCQNVIYREVSIIWDTMEAQLTLRNT